MAAMNGPATWPRPFVTWLVTWLSAVGITPCAHP